MVEPTDDQIEAALERGRILRETQPHAAAARYDPKSGRIIVDLTNGATFAFPTQSVQGLVDASPEQLAEVELWGEGHALHWETLDVDFTVPGLVNGIFGTAKWMAERAGRTSASANSAARVSEAKDGRPRKAG